DRGGGALPAARVRLLQGDARVEASVLLRRSRHVLRRPRERHGGAGRGRSRRAAVRSSDRLRRRERQAADGGSARGGSELRQGLERGGRAGMPDARPARRRALVEGRQGRLDRGARRSDARPASLEGTGMRRDAVRQTWNGKEAFMSTFITKRIKELG